MARMVEESRLYEANKKNMSYRKILDGIQKFSVQHSDSNEMIAAASLTSGKVAAIQTKPYK